MEWRRISRASLQVWGFSIVSLAFVVSSVGLSADWPNWRGPNYNGISDEAGWSTTWPEDGPKIAWKTSIGTGFASMAVSDGRVYAMGNIGDKDILYCFDEKTGKEIFRYSYPCPLFNKQHEGGPAATPTVSGDSVYVFSKQGDVLRINAETGEVIWHKELSKDPGVKPPRWFFAGSPFVMDGMVILNAGKSGIALKVSDGSVAWQNSTEGAGYSTAMLCTVNGKKCILLFGDKEFVCVESATGKQLWQKEWRTNYGVNATTPIVDGNNVFISTGYNYGCAVLRIGPDGVREVWRNKNMSNHINSSLLWEGHIYGFDGQAGGGGKLTCIDYRNGEVKWSQSGLGTGSLMLADGKLIVLSERGKLVIVEASPDGYKELASAQILSGKCWTVPTLANGRIYARNAAGDLVCIDVSG
jgi:outer membrane protein assembly factor BamB